MISTTITSKNGIEEIAGKSLREVMALASRLGYGWPLKSERCAGVWIHTYKGVQA